MIYPRCKLVFRILRGIFFEENHQAHTFMYF